MTDADERRAICLAEKVDEADILDILQKYYNEDGTLK